MTRVWPIETAADMNIGLIIPILFGFLLALITLIQNAGYHLAAFGMMTFAATLMFAMVQINNERAAIRIKKSLSEDRCQPLYHHAVRYLLPRAKRMFGVAEPSEETRHLWSLWRATLSYKLLDRALLLALIYPLFLLLFYWALSGQDAVLGNTVIIPAVDERWKGYATIGLVAFLLCIPTIEKRAAVVGAFAVGWLLARDRHRSASLVAIFAPATAIVASLVFLPWNELGDRVGIVTAVFLFLGVAPLINALFDAISYSVTLALTERGARGLALWFAAIDVVLALVLFLALGATFVCIVSWMNVVAGVEFIDLGSLLAQAGDTSRYWWLYAMLFSTALPTLIHLSVATLSLQAFLPFSWRARMCLEIEAALAGDLQAGIVATIALGTT